MIGTRHEFSAPEIVFFRNTKPPTCEFELFVVLRLAAYGSGHVSYGRLPDQIAKA